MKITLLMASTPNGFIAGPNDDTDWIKNFDSLYKIITDFGVVVMGKRTYQECVKYDVFPYKGATNIVMTHDQNLLTQTSADALFSDKEPDEIVRLAQEKGFERLLIIGGGHINGSFIKAGLIDEIVLDIHPMMMAKGIMLFENDFEYVNLELIRHEEINDQILRVSYKVKK